MPTGLDTDALVAKDRELAGIGARVGTKVRAKVERAFDDAEAHAHRALSRAVRGADEGMATVAAVRKSRPYALALARLEELSDALFVLLGDARLDLYRAAFYGWMGVLPAETTAQSRGWGPPEDKAEKFRASVIGSLPLADDLRSPIDRAGEQLERTLIAAGSRAVAKPDAEDLVTAWSERAKLAVLSAAQGALEDSLYRADKVAGRDCLRPELLEPDPTLD